jgi:hypothetical protein
MASILDLMNHVQQQGEMGRARGKETALGRLMAQGYQQGGDRSQLLGQIAQVSPQAAPAAQQSFNDDDHARMERVGQMAGMLLSAPPQARASLYAQQIVPAMHQLGMGEGLPPDWSDDLLPSVQGISQQLGGGGRAATGVQSTYVDAQGNRVAIMRDGSTQLLGQNAPNNQIIDTGNGFFGVNKGNLQAAPVMTGGAPGEVPFSIDPSLPPEVQAAIRSDPRAGSAGGIPEQLRSVAKPPAPPTQLQVNADARDAERLRLAQEAAAAKAEEMRAATAQKQQAGIARQQAASDSAQQLIDAIDTLSTAAGFDNLGTVKGDVAAGIPFVRNDTKDADAQLKNIAGQVALATMNKLKTLSAAGATGFGSLSAPELKLLQNSIASLQSENISHAQLVSGLSVIRRSMEKITGWKPPAQAETPRAATTAPAGDPLGIL